MSEPMRFSLKHHGQLSCVEHCSEGEYVLHSDYARLKAEVDEYRKDVTASVDTLIDERNRLKAEVERLKESNECLDKMHEKEMERSAYLCEEFNRTTAWGRGLESDLSHARVEISFLKAEVERLRASSFVTAVPVEEYERLLEAGDAVALDYAERIEIEAGETAKTLMKTLPVLREWNAAKEGKPNE